METESTFAVQAELRRHFEREAHTPLGMTLRALIRSDASRLQFFDGSLAIDHYMVQRKYVPGEIEKCVISAAQRDASLSAAIGYVLEPGGYRPEDSAWLVDGDGRVVDPAGGRRSGVLGWLGVTLRAVEVGRWTPTHPGEVAVSDLHRHAGIA